MNTGRMGILLMFQVNGPGAPQSAAQMYLGTSNATASGYGMNARVN